MTNDADTPAQGWATRLRQSADHDGIQELRMVMRRVATEIERHSPAESAPGHTDLMVTPESIDAFLEKNPPPDDRSQPDSTAQYRADRAEIERLQGVMGEEIDRLMAKNRQLAAQVERLQTAAEAVCAYDYADNTCVELQHDVEALRRLLPSTVQQPPQQQNDAG